MFALTSYPRMWPLAAMILAALTAAGSATAQGAAGSDIMVITAQNQLGVLEYCEGEGHIDAEASAIQRRIIAQMPAPDRATAADAKAAHAQGRKGVVAGPGVTMPLNEAARRQDLDEAALCGQISALVRQAGADPAAGTP
ncbi:MAG: hypothetical protein Q4G25_05635 [Paracoccus sp. (in: a-proteobacteria)]|nr:hypothetical protein [Paracoccus sp. (in: a-proteobacteria)]